MLYIYKYMYKLILQTNANYRKNGSDFIRCCYLSFGTSSYALSLFLLIIFISLVHMLCNQFSNGHISPPA